MLKGEKKEVTKMLNSFMIFVAPFIVLIGAMILSFWVASKDHIVE